MSLDKNTEAFHRTYARMLMEQAEALFRYGELGLAEELGNLALRQQAAFGPFESKPQDLLARIAAARRQGPPHAAAAASIRPLRFAGHGRRRRIFRHPGRRRDAG